MKNNINGYFQINIKSDGTYLELYKENNGGKPLAYDEINRYLSSQNIHNFDVVKLGRALSSSNQFEQIKLTHDKILSVSEQMDLEISSDNMTVIARFYPPSTDGNLLDEKDIVNLLRQSKVVHGIKGRVINDFLNNRKYCTDYIIAEGEPIIQGSNASIQYHFNIDLTRKPKTNEDGSVDFHQLDTISHCKEGDLLATLTPVVYGIPGKDIHGKTLAPARVNNKRLKRSPNVKITEDGFRMISMVNGHVSLQDDNVIVSDIYEIPGHVDNSTGDINYNGSAVINGNVLTGFSVRATGDVVVSGVVEGATIIAGGDIVLKRGMQGMNKGLLKAEGNIISKFIENTKVESGGYITTESIMHSTVSAVKEITVGGRRGFISGGRIRSGASITAKNVGSNMGTNTVLEVGQDPKIMDNFTEIEKQLNDLHANKEKIATGLKQLRKRIEASQQVSEEMRGYIQSLMKNNIHIENEIKEKTIIYEELREIVENNTLGDVRIQGAIHPGATIVISNLTHYVKDTTKFSRFIRDGADIKTLPYK